MGAARLGKRRSEWAGTVAERFCCAALFRYEEIETKGVELLLSRSMLLRAPANTPIVYLRRDAIRRGCGWPAARLL